MPVDAERWLASRGIQREPIRVTPAEEPGVAPAPGAEVAPDARPPDAQPSDARTETSTATEVASQPEQQGPADSSLLSEAASDASAQTVESALGFIRRSTSNAPQSEGRLRTKLEDRGYPGSTIDEAMVLARAERLVDDAAMLAALIVERRARGHADPRLRRDLRGRGFSGPQVDEALAQFAATDPAAAVFALAREQASRHRGVEAEAAVRRTVGYLVRRGHGEGLARKAARDAVYADREAQQVAER
jgi:SOS response regulatory protein OraA/RecX